MRILARPLAPLVILLAAAAATLIFFDRPLIRGDGVSYLAWVDTIALDHDLDLSNQVERLRPVLTYQIQWNATTQRWVIVFPFGVGILQAPFYAIGNAFAAHNWLNINPDYFRQNQGVELPYSFWLMIGANVWTLLALAFTWLAGRRLCDGWTAALATYAVFLGTPIFYYSTIAPLNSHNAGGFAIAGFVYLLARCTGAFKPSRETGDENNGKSEGWCWWAMMGVCAGLAVLARWQLAVAVAPGFLLLLYERRLRGFIIAATAAAITVLPLPFAWQYLFGSPFLIPFDAVEGQKGSFLSAPNHGLDVLVQTLIHSPIIVLSLVGIPILWKRSRPWAVMAFVAFFAQIIVNGAALDWWAGESYGMRRMSELYPLYGLLACAALQPLSAQWAAGKQGIRLFYARHQRLIYRLLLAGIIGYTGVYIAAFIVYSWTNPDHYLLGRPDVMLSYFFNHPYRMEVLNEVIRTHVGPQAWAMPGP
jgi:hypothetical protein